MALSKVLDKFRPKTEPKNASEESSRTSKSSKHHQQDGSHRSSDPKKKKLVKVRSTRKAPPKKSPNFMKSTTSNDVKEPTLMLLKPLEKDSLEQKECSYSYCSLHGHEQGPLPSLKRLLSSRRSIKVQKSLKLRGFSPARKIEDVVNELFIDIQSKPESSSITSFEDSEDKNSELSVDEIQVINQFLELVEKGSLEEKEERDIRKTNSNKLKTESSENSISCEGDKVKDCSSGVSKSAVKYGNLRRQSSKFRESVDLKHFTVEERKSAEEWTVDFALRKALKRLGSKRKVPLLVAAFETVVPQLSESLKAKKL